jgi:phosphoglycolate phosphatase-like HAD superfamily hydrolase
VVGDSPSDIQTARAAGARIIGYATAVADAEHLANVGAEAILFSMADLVLRLRARVLDPNM